MCNRVPPPRLLAYFFWSFVNTLFFRMTRQWFGRWPVSPIQWWLLSKADDAYPRADRRKTGGLP
jgi:hypothetical protein